jgi:hypothetical protein
LVARVVVGGEGVEEERGRGDSVELLERDGVEVASDEDGGELELTVLVDVVAIVVVR